MQAASSLTHLLQSSCAQNGDSVIPALQAALQAALQSLQQQAGSPSGERALLSSPLLLGLLSWAVAQMERPSQAAASSCQGYGILPQ